MQRVSQRTMQKMRNYAIKQALTELDDNASQEKIAFIARRHGLTYAELKQAYRRSRSLKND